MPSYPPPLGGNPYKFTVFNNYAQWGWTDTFYYSSDKIFSDQDLKIAATQLASQLRQKNATGVSIPAVRVTALEGTDPLLKSAQQTTFFTSDDMGLPPVPAGFNIDSPWNAGLFTIPDRSGTYKRPWLVRGFIPAWSSPIPGVVPATAVSPNLLTWKNTFSTKVFGQTATGGQAATVFTGIFSMKGVIKNPTFTLPTDIVTMDFTPTGNYFRFTFKPPAGWSNRPDITGPWVGQWIVIRGMKFRCGKGPNGKSQITDVTSLSGGVFQVTINKRWCCAPGGIEIKTFGKASVLKYGLFGLGRMSFERIVKRDTGGAFFGTAGRQGAKCC